MRLAGNRVLRLFVAAVFLWTIAARISAQNPLDGFGRDVVVLDEAARRQALSRTKMATASFIRDEGDFAIIELAGDYDRDLANGDFNIDARVAVAEQFYQNHDDEYDFLVVFTGFEFATPGARAFYLSVFNDIEGIGQNQFDNRTLFGSEKLQGYIDMAAFGRYELDVLEPDFDSTLDTMVHEVMHRWGVFVRYLDGNGQPNADWLGFQDAHWSQYVDSGASVMGGADWRNNSDGTFTALDIRRGYGPVDLYLAGFVEPDPSDSLFYIRNPDGDPEQYWPIPGDVTSGIAEQVAIQQIIDLEGPRVPSAAESQREFRAGFIFLVRPGSFPSDALLIGLNDARRGLAQRFDVETRGLGVVHTGLAESSALSVNDPDIVQGGPPANGLADFAAAVDWLLAAQDPAGFWGDKPETRLRDTALALRALELLEVDAAGLLLARNWIRNQTAVDNDDSAWILASRALGNVEILDANDALGRAQNPDGGWGLSEGGGSSSYDTALLLQYLAEGLAAIPGAVNFLRASRRDGSGWGALSNGSNQVVTTALALQSLIRAGVSAGELTEAANWLTGTQLGTGAFGEGTGSAHETALALSALGLISGTPAATIDAASSALEGLQAADGSWSGSVYSTALALDALRNRQNPNLAIAGQIQLAPSSPRDGDLVEVNYLVTNAGLFNTPAVTAQAYLGDPQAGGTAISSPTPVPPLQAGENLSIQTFWDTFGLEGGQQVFVWVDNGELLAESSEGDNLTSLDVAVAAPPAEADIAILANSLNFSPTVVGALPTDFQAQITVRNLGASDAAGVAVALQRRRPGGALDTLTSQSVDLPGRSSQTLELTAQLTESGLIELRIAADPDDLLTEPNESNNSLEFDVPTADALDLAVLPGEVQLLTGSPAAGQDVDFQFVLRNLGTVDAPPVSFTAAIQFGGDTEVLLEQVIQLVAGQADPRNLSWRASGVGDARLVVTIDSAGQAVEGDETNNQASLDFVVGTVSQPNLAVDFENLNFTPNPGLESQTLSIEIPVRNTSDVAAGPYRVEVFDGVPAEGGSLLEGLDFAGLAAGGQQDIQVTTTPLVGGGQRLYYVAVDTNDEVTEFDETDNTAFDQIEILRLPDLAITPANVILAPTLPIPGSPIEATVTVDNLGQQTAVNVSVTVLEVDGAGLETLVGGPSFIASIDPDTSQEIAFNWTFDNAQAGVENLRVVVDSSDQVLEISNANNIADVRTDLQNQTFFVSERYISPNGDGIKDLTAIGYSLEQPQADSIVIQDSLSRSVKTFRGSALASAQRGQVIWDGRGDRGSVVRDGNYQARLLDAGGGLLGQTLIIVDTNRSPLLDAVGTPAAYYNDLRCSVEFISSPKFAVDGRHVYTQQVRDLNGDLRGGLFRVPTRGRGLDQLLSDTFLSQLVGGSSIQDVTPLPDGRIVFTNGAGCGNCARGMWIKSTPLAEPVQLDTAGIAQFDVFRAGPDYALIEEGANDALWKVFYQPGVPAQLLQSPGSNMNFWAEVNGGWLMSRFFGGDFDGETGVFGEHLYFISADPGVAFAEIIFGPEVTFQISPDRRYVAAFASDNEFEFSPPGFGVVRAARMTGPVPEVYFERSQTLGDFWDIQVSLSPGNQLMILDGNEAKAELFDPSGTPMGEVTFPTRLFDDYADAVPAEPGSRPPTVPVTKFADWSAWLDPDNIDDYVVAWSTDTREFLVELALVYPSGGGEKSAETGEKRVPRDTHFSQFYKVSLSDLEPELIGTINHEAEDIFIFPQELETINPFQLVWLAREDRVLFERSSLLDTLELEPEGVVNNLVLGRLGDAWPKNYGSMYKKLALSSFLPADDLKCAGLGQPTPILESADNLISHLEISRFASVIELNGVAADRHLQNYQLDWAFADDPDTWFTLTSASNEKIIDDLLATWVPPDAGSFRVRLRVTDLAGNVEEDIRSVSWLDPANLANVQMEPRYLSPNGDGVQDEATLSFRVLRPINLDVTVENSGGQVIRTLSGQYPTVTGDIETLTWDGRDNGGFLVPEDTYLMRVENRRFRIVVDITPPQVSLLLPRAYQAELDENDVERVAANYLVAGTLEEPNLEQGIVEFRRGNEPWNELELYSAPPEDNSIGIPVPRELYVPGEFRLSASDLAGNRAQILASNQFEDLILKDLRQFYFIRDIDVSKPPEKKILLERLQYIEPPITPVKFPEVLVPVVSDRIGLAMDLTFGDAVDQYYVELAEPGDLSNWAAIPKSPAPLDSGENFEDPEEISSAFRHLFVLQLTELQGLEDVYIRIRADIGGISYYSNGLRLKLDPGLKIGTMRRALSDIAKGELEPEQDVELIRLLNDLVPLKDTTITQFWVRESLVGMPDNARLLVESIDDARYFNETAFLTVTEALLEPPSEFSAQMFEVPTSPCRNYQVSWEADFSDGAGGFRPVRFPPVGVSRSCLTIDATRYAIPGPFCGETSVGQVQIRVELATQDPDILPISLDVFDRDTAGNEILIANVVAPKVGVSYPLDIDLSQLVSGQRALRFRVVDSVGDVSEERVLLPVDRTRPQLSLDFPGDGEQLCAIQGADGSIQLPLEGEITDDFSGDFAYKAYLGSGHVSPQLELVGGVPAKIQGGNISCNLNQQLVNEDCLQSRNTSGELGLYDFPEEHQFEIETGPVTALIEAMDWSGERYCAMSQFELDARVDARVNSEFPVFSPNGDGVLDSATILVQALEPLTMSVTVYRPTRLADGTFDTGPSLGEIVSSQPLEGDFNFEWLGDAGAGVLSDDRYLLRFDFVDDCGLTKSLDSVGEIDTTPPFVRIDYPLDNDPVGAIVEVLGRFTDAHFQSANVDYGTGDFWINLENHNRQVIGGRRIATWVLTGLEAATYNLRAQARDRAGNEAEVVVSLQLDMITSLLWALQSEPAYISPNDDGLQDATSIGLGVQDTGLFTVDIRSQGGALINRLADAVELAAGSHNFEWDGTNTAGDVVADGDYVVEVTATDVAQSGFSQTEQIGVVVDTFPPELALARPVADGFIQGQGTYVFTTDDEHFASVRAWEQPLEPAGPETLLLDELQAGGFSRGDLAALAEGRHAIRLEANDLAGNVSEIMRSFTVDNTPPEADLFTPMADELLGGANPAVDITGRVADANFSDYELAVRPAGSADPWQVIASGTEIPIDELLAQWTVNVPDGDYSLRLLARDRAGLETTVAIVVNVDTTAPVAIITEPLAEAVVTQGALVRGTATDTNFKQYRLRIADAADSDPVWSDIAIKDAAVNGGVLLEWNNPPADGRYRLQLVVEDAVGLSASAETIVLVDQTPPEPPSNLRAEVQAGFNVQLDWDAGSAPDLAGYLVYRNGSTLNNDPITRISYLDPDVPEGDHEYWVVAVDSAGNQSEPTNTETITIDRTPPDTVLIAPAEGDRVRGIIPIIGTASSADDFFEYRLYVRVDGSAEPGELLIQSPTSVTGERLVVWDTTTVVQDQTYVILLEAEDTSSNVGSDERRVLVDNLPPAAPTGLTAALQGASDAQLDWNANTESDLAGYLLYRNGQLVNASGDVGADLLPFALTDTTYLDLDLSDGTHTYQVFAIDVAGNVSAGSNSAEVLVETGPPETLIVEPENNARFEQPLRIVAESPDLDIQSVLFEYRAAGSATWIALGAPDTDSPYQTTLDPAAEALQFGDFEIQATATDTGGLPDLTPALLDVVYADLTAPEDPFNLAVSVNGGDVTLTWEHADPDDVDEFLIYRGQEIDDIEEWDSVIGPDTTYVDTGVVDGDYLYFVTAVDLEFNESEATDTESTTVFTPLFDHPFTPTQVDNFSIAGASPIPGVIDGQLQSDSGTTVIGPLNTAADGSFDLGTLPLVNGVNSLDFSVTDGVGNISKPGIAVMERGTPPSAPLNPAAVVSGFDVTFGWEAPPEPNVVGYRPFRDIQPLIDDERIAGATFVVSSNPGLAPRAGDGNIFNYWYPFDADLQDGTPAFIEAQFSQARLFTAVQLDWRSGRRPTDYAIEAWSGFVWVPVARVTLPFGSVDNVDLVQPYYTDRLRMLVLAYNVGSFQPVRVAEFRFDHRPLDLTTQFAETRPDGSFDYTVTAINDLGFEGPASAVATAEVGDVEPPPAVVLSGAVSGSDAVLSWTESVALDLAEYRLFRDGVPILVQTDVSVRDFTDVGLVNGTYNYEVVAVDGFGNISDPSNTVELTIAVQGVGAPLNLVVSDVPGGGALDLSWQPGAGELPSGHRVMRALQSGGSYTQVAEITESSYRDLGLSNGVTYFYVVTALDAVGNESGPSNEDSGTPQDDASPQPPVFLSPTVAGQPITISALVTDVAGEAEPGVSVEIRRNVDLVGTVPAVADFTLDFIDVGVSIDDGNVSPNGRYLAVKDFPDHIVEIPSGQTTNFTFGFTDMAWAADSGSIYTADNDFAGELRRYDVNGQLVEIVVSGWDRIVFGVPSPDAQRFLISGQTVNPASGVSERGIWILDRSDDSIIRLGDFDLSEVAAENVEWSEDGTQVVFVERDNGTDLQHYEAVSGMLQVLVAGVSQRPPAFNGDDTQVAYTAPGADFENVFVVDVATGVSTQITDDQQTYRNPQWSLDDRYLAYQGSCCEVFVTDLILGGMVFAGDVDFIEQIRWLNTGQLFLLFSSDYATLSTPGYFLLKQMPLVGGDNEVIATAFDDAGNFSPPSAPILIQVPADDFPDLAILDSDLGVLPPGGAPGDTFNVSLVVRNLGPMGAPAAAVSLRLLGPDGSSEELVALQGPVILGAGAQKSFNITVGPLTAEGIYRLVGNVDPDGLIAELDENNNLAEATFQVTSSILPLLTLRVDQREFAPGSTITGNVDVYNPGSLFIGRVEVTAEDEAGFVFNFNQTTEIPSLDFAQTLGIPVAWDPGNVFSGTYRFRATLYDQSGMAIQEATQEFAIGRFAEFALTVAADRTNFEPLDNANLVADLRFVEGNVAVSDGSLTWQAIAPSGAVVWTESTILGTLTQGFRANLQQTWPVDNAATGTYRLRVELASADATAEAEVLVNVVDPADVLLLAGSISVDTPVIAIGRLFDVNYTVENVGTLAADQVPVSLRLLRTAGLAQLLNQDSTLDLGVGASADLSVSWDSSILGFESYLIVLSADLSALGGSADTILDSVSISGIDATPPELTIITPLTGTITNADVQLTAESVDALSSVELVTARIDSGGAEPMGVANETGVYQRFVFDLTEGQHTFQATSQDVWGNQTESEVQTFTVDRTPPVIDIAGVNDGDLLNVAVTPVITVTDDHLDTTVIQLNGQDFVSGTTVNTDGAYLLFVSANDLAGNRSEAQVSFVLDFTPPTVTVTFPAPGAIMQNASTAVTGSTEAGALVSIQVNTFAAQTTADPMGEFSFATVPLQPGDNILALDAVDPAGNQGPETTLTVTFAAQTIEIAGSIAQPADPHPIGQTLNVAYTVSNDGNATASGLPVRVRLINTASATVVATDNAAFDVGPNSSVSGSGAFDTQALSLGLHRLELEAQVEGVWMLLDMKVVTIADLTAPDVSLLGPAAGSVNPTSVEITALASDQHSALDRVEYILDLTAPAGMVLTDPATGEYRATVSGLAHGNHSVAVQAFDVPGNQATTPTITFEVDTLPPVIVVTGVDKGGLYNTAVTPIITITDDNPDQEVITLDGQPFVSGTTIATEGVHELFVQAQDVVGNVNSVTINFEIDVTGPVVTITSPVDGAELSGNATDVLATTEPNAVVTLVAGAYTQTQPADSSGQVTFTAVPLEPGLNTITLSAVDRAGNQGPDAAITVNVVSVLYCAFQGEVDDIDGDLNSEFKKKDDLNGVLTIDLATATIVELNALLGNYPFQAIPGGPTVAFDNNVDDEDRILISGDDQFVGEPVKRRPLIAFEIELVDGDTWIEALQELEGQAWEQREEAEWRLIFGDRGRDDDDDDGGSDDDDDDGGDDDDDDSGSSDDDDDSGSSDDDDDDDGGNDDKNPRVDGPIEGFCSTDPQDIAGLAPLTLAAAPADPPTLFIDIEGITGPGATVVLTKIGYTATTIADDTGYFLFANVPLTPGLNSIELVATNATQTSNTVTLGVMGPAAQIPGVGLFGILLLVLLTGMTGMHFARRLTVFGETSDE